MIAKRIKYRRPIYEADRWHFHHRLASVGFSQRQTLLYLYGWALVLAGLALALRFVPYSDNHGHFDAAWTAVIVVCGVAARRGQRLPARRAGDPQAPQPETARQPPVANPETDRRRRRPGARDRELPGGRSGDRRVRDDRGRPGPLGAPCAVAEACPGAARRRSAAEREPVRIYSAAPPGTGSSRACAAICSFGVNPMSRPDAANPDDRESPGEGGRCHRRNPVLGAMIACAAVGFGVGSLVGLAVPARARRACSGGSARVLRLSTLAIEGSSSVGGRAGPFTLALRYGDLALLAVALPLFVIAGWPMLGYAVAAAAWLAQRGIELAADRRAARALAERQRNTALGVIGASTLGRVWLVALAVLLVGLLGAREDGLAAALLSAVLMTAHLGGRSPGARHDAGRGAAMKTAHEGLDRGRGLPRRDDPARGPVRQRRQERRVPAPERVQARPVDHDQARGSRPEHQQGGPLPWPGQRPDDRNDGLGRQAHAAKARTASRPRSRSPTT